MRTQFDRTIFMIAVAAIAVMLLSASNTSAFATNPYAGGRQSGVSPTRVVQIWGNNNFAGSTPSSMTDHILSVITTAGWQGNPGTATAVIYQGVVRLNPDDTVDADPQVHKNTGSDTTLWGCFQSGTCPILAQGTRLDYAYQTFYWNTPRTQVSFYTETHDIWGIVNYVTQTYTKGSQDTSDNFAAGEKFISNPFVGDAYVKLLQFGVESDTSTSNWKVKQYGMGYTPVGGSNTYLANQQIYEVTGDSDQNVGFHNGSEISWYVSGGYNYPFHVGRQQYSVQGDYHHLHSSVPSGTMYWWYGSPAITPGTQLWP